jgi:hypothetical protein
MRTLSIGSAGEVVERRPRPFHGGRDRRGQLVHDAKIMLRPAARGDAVKCASAIHDHAAFGKRAVCRVASRPARFMARPIKVARPPQERYSN